jgi:indolepyruvate ferredoxin oxidoreductase alpha subunit
LEENLKSLIIDRGLEVRKVLGKRSGHVSNILGAGIGEVNPDLAAQAIEKAWGYKTPPRTPVQLSEEGKVLVGMGMSYRDLAFCAGCPHRASFWVTNQAIKLDDRGGLVMGDIGCYSMGAGRTGYFLPRTMHCMGSGIGFANGLAQLKGFDRPVLAFAGDSTFFHSCIPALVNAKYNQADLTLIVLDNSATSMTGFQPHPGTGRNALGEEVEPIDIVEVCRGIGVPTFVMDPFEVEDCTYEMADLMQQGGLKVIIFRHPCALVEAKKIKKEDRPRVIIDVELCVGASCGCNQFCSRVFGCPALIWNPEKGCAEIDEVLCTRCGVCVSLCPQGAIKIAN